MRSKGRVPAGRLRKAPESFVTPELIQDISRNGLDDTRRSFLRSSFAAATAVVAGGSSARALAATTDGDPMITELRPWSTSLGQPVASRPYGMPSKYEANLQRRQSPGLT
ncbi:MAG TPA: sulfite dehydrogenase, partial [Burkholderiaceae bacterium]|nr:sulfite dehydrogenase [Burkholderiaceae bacterium]